MEMERKVLIRAAELVAMGWCQYRYGLTAANESVDLEHLDRAERVCMFAALWKANQELDAGRCWAAARRLQGRHAGGVTSFNDTPGRTADEVEAALRAAAAAIPTPARPARHEGKDECAP